MNVAGIAANALKLERQSNILWNDGDAVSHSSHPMLMWAHFVQAFAFYYATVGRTVTETLSRSRARNRQSKPHRLICKTLSSARDEEMESYFEQRLQRRTSPMEKNLNNSRGRGRAQKL